MPSNHEILCINKTDRMNPHERILSIGGRNPDGTAWKLAQEEAIRGIEAGKWLFYVRRGGRSVNVIVSASGFGNKHLKTEADVYHPDNLLSLPECR